MATLVKWHLNPFPLDADEPSPQAVVSREDSVGLQWNSVQQMCIVFALVIQEK